jgi:hypothetical protein
MKKALLLGSLLCVLTSAPAHAQVSGQIVLEFPQGNDWRRHNDHDRYWRQVRLDNEARERAHEERRLQEYYENHHTHSNNGCGPNNRACHKNNGHKKHHHKNRH